MKSIKIFLIVISPFVAASAFAQQKGTGFIGVSGGISLPIGNWGKVSTATSLTSFNGTVNDASGYATVGGFGALEGAWFFSTHFGFGGMFKYGTYNLHGMDSLSYGYEKSFDVDTTRLTHTTYKIWSVMPGLYYHLSIAQHLSLTARALVGIADASTPNITVTIEDGGVFDPPAIQYSASKIAFAFDAGAGLNYALQKGISVNLRIDYFYTKPDFTLKNSPRNNNAGREVREYDQSLASANVSLGLAYAFGKK
ncbi:MAG TPA: outer membrane beta-barrel protein [Puia sp.]|nr:outer membrane beta-barrel protein [Puia sp.]